MVLLSHFPRPFQHYRPRSHKVYGVVCITVDDRVLLVRGRQTGIWSFPKGHLKSGEVGQDCALRELREETGVVLPRNEFTFSKKLYAGEYFFYRVDEALPIEIQDDSEVLVAEWVPLAELDSLHGNVDVVNLLGRLRRECNNDINEFFADKNTYIDTCSA